MHFFSPSFGVYYVGYFPSYDRIEEGKIIKIKGSGDEWDPWK
jgi:hypothetical protein